MGPRTFLAGWLTDFLLHHGHLDKHVVNQIQFDHCLQMQSPTVPLWKVLTSTDANDVAYEPQIARHHSAMLMLIASIVTYHLEKQKKLNRKGRIYSSSKYPQLSKYIDGVPLFIAHSSLFLLALHVISMAYQSLPSSLIGKPLFALHLSRIIGTIEGKLLSSQQLYMTSLWFILVSILFITSSELWSILDPRIETTKRTWNRIDVKRTAGMYAFVGMVLWLAYIDLPLLRKIINGNIRVDFGLPQILIHALKQTLSSFIGFCIFNKLLPQDSTVSSDVKIGTRKPKKHILDQALVQRMSTLAREASERVQARKDGKKLKRSYSVPAFTVTTPPTRNRATLTLLPARSQMQYPPSPLMDIQLVGPTLSSTDLLAKLRDNQSMKRNMSNDSLVGVQEPLRIAIPKLPYLVEEEKVLEDDSPPTPTAQMEDLAWGNPQLTQTTETSNMFLP